ncbi:MAG: penicillin-binding protein activator, partial [Bdellovibrionota bacterium]
RYNLATAQFDSGAIHEADATLHLLQPELLDDDGRIKVAILRAQVFLRQAKVEDAIRVLLNHGHLAATPERLALLTGQMDAVLAVSPDLPSLERLAPEADGSPLADRVWFIYSGRLLQAGNLDQAEKWLGKLVDGFPSSSHFTAAQEQLRSISDQSVVNGKAVGILLPLTGKYASFGRRSLQAIALAFHLYGPQKKILSDGGISLFVEDSGDTIEQTLRGLDALSNEHKVVAVIGPLISKGIDQVFARAAKLRMPLVSLAQQSGVPSEYTLNAGLTPRAQAEEVARHAIEKLGFEKFAILFPQDTFGRKYAESFWDAVEAKGGRITAVESYAAGETDFRQMVDRMIGLYDLNSRQRELEELSKARDEAKVTKKTRKTEKFYNLPPIVDFDAVFIPEEPKAIGQIIPTFSYRDAGKVRFLGISAWHSPELLTRTQGFAECAVF